MRITTFGTYKSENLIELGELVMAQLQDAGVTHFKKFSLYVTPCGQSGKEYKFVKDGLELEKIVLDATEWRVPEPEESTTSIVPRNAPSASADPQNKQSCGRRQNRNYGR